MKNNFVLYSLIVAFLAGCNSENTIDCLKKEGETLIQKIDLPAFEEITVHDNVKLFIASAEEQSVRLETGKNLADEIDFSVEGNHLHISNHNTCNLFRDYENVKVYIGLPELTYLRNASPFTIESTNTLAVETIQLVAEDAQNRRGEYHTDGDFDLQIEAQRITIVSNGYSNYFLSGEVEHFDVGFYAGGGRLEGENLIAQNISIYHRGSNKMIVNPQKLLDAELWSTGDVIAVNRPPIVDVEEHYTGQLIVEE